MSDEVVVPRNVNGSASTNPDTFLKDINDTIDELAKAIEWFIDEMSGIVEEHIAEIAGLGGWVAGGVVGGAGGYLLGRRYEKRFKASVQKVRDAWKEQNKLIIDSVGAMIGDPLQMAAISSAYRDAAAVAGEATGMIEEGNALLKGASFNARAYEPYVNVSNANTKALAGVQTQLLNAAKIMDNNQTAILKYWNKQLWNLLNAIDDFYEIAGDLGDLGNAPTFEAGPAVKLIGEVIGTAGTILSEYGNYFIDLNVTSAGDWHGINSAFGGTNGMPGAKWPTMDEANRDAINQPWK